jgi:hypothetical protein
MALLDLLQLPDGSFGMPAGQSSVDPFTGASPAEVAAQARDAAAERTRRGIRRPAPSGVDYSQWDSGASPVPFAGLSSASDAAAALAPSPAPMTAPPVASPAAMAPATPASAGAGPAPIWPGMLNAPLPSDMVGGGYPRPAPAPAAAPVPPPASAALPATSTPATGPIDTPAPVPPTSMLGRIGDMLNNRSSTLLALGAGLMGSQNLGRGCREDSRRPFRRSNRTSANSNSMRVCRSFAIVS